MNLLHPTRNLKNEAPGFGYEPVDFNPERTLFLKAFGRIKLRPICPVDEARMVQFHSGLSEESIYLRYFEHISLDTRTLHERLSRVCSNNADSLAIVAEKFATGTRPAEIFAVGRLTTTGRTGEAAFALLLGDEAVDTDLPAHLLEHLIGIARAYRFHSLTGELLVADHDAINLCRRLGFQIVTRPQDGIVQTTLIL